MITPTLSLYDLAEEAVALDGLTAMDEGEWTPEAEALAIELTAKLVAKADTFGAYMQTLSAQDVSINDEITRLAARRKAILNKSARLKRYALMAMQTMDQTKIEGKLFTLTVQQTPPSVEVVDDSALPAEYVRIVPESKAPDKVAIAKALKAGVEVPGCFLTTTQTLRIR
jgi:hypothetical protein